MTSDSEFEFGPEAAGALEQPRDPPVDPVEHPGDDDRSNRLVPFAGDAESDAGQPEAQRQHGHGTRNQRADRNHLSEPAGSISAARRFDHFSAAPSLRHPGGDPGTTAPRDDRLTSDAALAGQHFAAVAGGQIDVDAAAEADQPDALPGDDALAGIDETDDPPRDQPGDLGEADAGAVAALDDEILPLVVVGSLVEVGVEELARDIGDSRSPSRSSASGSRGRRTRS